MSTNLYPFEIIKSGFTDQQLINMLNYFLTNIEWKEDQYKYGYRIVIPRRKTFMFGSDYSYSGQNKKGIPFSTQMKYIKNNLEKQLNLDNDYFNGCLLNLYEDGEASISAHRDNEKEMDVSAIIISFSLGSTRSFIFKNTVTSEKVTLSIKNGDILIMKNNCQKDWIHSIPKELKIKEPRISLTFRKFLNNK